MEWGILRKQEQTRLSGKSPIIFLAAQSSSRSLVVGRSVGLSVCWSVGLSVCWSVGRSVGWCVHLYKKKVYLPTYLPTYTSESSNTSDSRYSIYSSDSSGQ